jgi:hypothetical protein
MLECKNSTRNAISCMMDEGNDLVAVRELYKALFGWVVNGQFEV